MEDIIIVNKRLLCNLFAPCPNHNSIQITREGIRSITPYKVADEIANRLVKYGVLSIIDATANVGGNTIAFAKVFPKVVSYEIKQKTYFVLNNNIAAYRLTNVTTYNRDFNDDINKVFGVDAIFIDPPWYIDGLFNDKMTLAIKNGDNNVSIEESISKIWTNNPEIIICVKVPKNYKIKMVEMDIIEFKKMDILIFIKEMDDQ